MGMATGTDDLDRLRAETNRLNAENLLRCRNGVPDRCASGIPITLSMALTGFPIASDL
ncbi:hypothetical protein [Paracoccus angustae]|uniref:hypothetical protein n=1 Tax=Paracoccus angustae TaxID=1671480 RepID=UPI00366C7142